MCNLHFNLVFGFYKCVSGERDGGGSLRLNIDAIHTPTATRNGATNGTNGNNGNNGTNGTNGPIRVHPSAALGWAQMRMAVVPSPKKEIENQERWDAKMQARLK